MPASGEHPDLFSASLLERETEFDELCAAFPDAADGHGRLTLVEGVAGSGKSSLLAAAQERAEADGLRTLRARGGELERGFAFGTIRQLFEPALTSANSAERKRLLAGAAEPAASVLASDRAGAHAESGFGVLNAVYWLATNLCARSPLLIAVDDLHWVDQSSLRALSYLARRIADLPIALVVALRPDEPGTPVELLDELRLQPGAAKLGLRALSAEAVVEVVRNSLPGADDALCRACFEASAGNPFYLRELLRALTGNGHGALDPDAVRDATVPAVGARVLRRIAHLGSGAPALARAMAVLGDGGRLPDAAVMAGLDEPTAASAAAGMRRVEILAREDPFEFVHPIVRRSVYDSLTVTERDEAHSAAARLLREGGAAPEVVAAHMGLRRPSGSSEAVNALRDAAKESLARGAPEAATAALNRALEERATEPGRSVLLHELGSVEVVGRDQAAIAHLTEALELEAEPVRRARIALDLSVIVSAAGRWDELTALVPKVVADLGDRDPGLALEFDALYAVVRAYDVRLVDGFLADQERLLGLARGDQWPALALSALLGSMGAARGQGPETTLPLVEHSLRGGRLFEQRGAGGWAAAQALGGLIFAEEHDRAEQEIERVAAQARRDGSLIGALQATANRSWVYARRGDLAVAEAEIRAALDLANTEQMFMDVASAFYFVEDVIGERPTLDSLGEMIEPFDPDPTVRGTGAGAMLLDARGRIRHARGDRDGAVADLRACGPTFEKLNFGPVYTTWRSALALALGPEDGDEARALMELELELTAAPHMWRPRAIALRASAVLDANGETVDRLRESVALLEHTDARLELARSLVELGSALRRRSQRAEAREPLSAGLDLASRCGAERTVARAGAELKAAGARPRRSARTGLEALTASELRVAQLVAEGRTNTEVAQELFVSLKTIETHLSHAYAKLGVSGSGARRHLADTLGRSRRDPM